MKTTIKNIGGKNIIARAEDALSLEMDKLFYFLSTVESKIVDGYAVQIGWSIFILSKREEGYLVLVPDYTKKPFQDTTDDLTLALWVQLEQVHCVRQLNIAGVMTKFNDKIVVAKNVLQLDEIYLQRSSDCDEGDSGWYIGPLNEADETEELEETSAYELLKIRPSIIQVLSLPYDYLAILEKDNIKAIVNENNINVLDGITN